MRRDEAEAIEVHADGISPARRAAFASCLILFSLVWVTVGFGLIDLASGLVGHDPLSAAYGVIAAVVLPLGFLAQLRDSGRVAGVQQILLVALAFALAGALSLDPLSFVSVAMLAIMVAVLQTLHPLQPRLLARSSGLNTPLAAVTVLGTAPWIVYALRMAANERGNVPPLDASRPQAGGWAGAAVLALSVVLLALLAARSRRGLRVQAWSSGIAAFVFGLVSVISRDAAGTAGYVWGGLAIVWSVALVGTAEWESRRC